MASDTATTSQPTPDGTPAPSEHEVLIDRRIRQTKRQVRIADLAVSLLVLAVGVLAYLFLAAVVDHWVLGGGLAVRGRFLFWLGLLAGVGTLGYRYLLPLLIRPISSVYAAQTLEQCRPGMKNSLVNLLFLRRERGPNVSALERSVLDNLEQTTAGDVRQIPTEMVVDHKRVIQLGAVLTAIIAVVALYLVISPKNPLPSFGRVLLPWADIAVPTRVTISDIKPEDVIERQGRSIVVSADIDGVRNGESVYLYYTTADRQSVDQAIPMTIPSDGVRYQCSLPPGQLGLQQDLRYYLVAGDCTTRDFYVNVLPALTILVDSVHYDYPDYTGIADETITHGGDLRAIEGTEVTLSAVANVPIKSASIELDCDPTRARRMTIDEMSATGSLLLQLDPDDPSAAEFDSYQLRFRDAEGEENHEPIRHTIDVIRDLPPEIRLIDPPAQQVKLPESGRLTLSVRAEDPDFALARVVLHVEREGQDLDVAPLLNESWQGVFNTKYVFQPKNLGLKPGEEVAYWLEAIDNKTPEPNRAKTEQRWITVVADDPGTRSSDPDGQADADSSTEEEGSNIGDLKPEETPQDPSDDNSDTPEEGEPSQEGGQQGDQSGGGGSGGESSDQEPPEGSQGGEQGEGESEGDDQASGENSASGDTESESENSSDDQEGQIDPDKESEPSDEPSDSAAEGEDTQDGEPGGEQDPSQEGGPEQEQPAEPIDGETNPGDVFEEVMKQMEKEKEKGEQAGDDSQDPSQGDEPSDDTGEKTDGGEESPSEDSSQDPGEPEGSGSDNESTGPEDPQNEPQQTPSDSDEGESPDAGEQSTDPDPSNQPPADPANPTAGPESPEEGTGGEEPDEEQSQGNRDKGESPPGGREKDQAEDSDQPGMGNEGGNTEASEGSDAAGTEGEGQTGTDGGDDTAADKPTGQPDEQQPGEGSPGDGSEGESQEGPPDNSDDNSSTGEQAGGDDSEQPEGQENESESEGTEGSPNSSQGGNSQGNSQASAGNNSAEEESGSEANLEYADQATDLALEYLEDQLAGEKPNQELLDRLGWDKDELAQFVDRWQKFKKNAPRDPSGDPNELDEALKSLGLRPKGAELREGGTLKDDRRATEALRFDPPPGWESRFRAYNQGTRGQDR